MSHVNSFFVGAFFLTSLVFVLYAPSDCDKLNKPRKKNRKSKNVASKISEEYSSIHWENWKLLKSYLDGFFLPHNYLHLDNDDTESEGTEEMVDFNFVSEYVDAASQLPNSDFYLNDDDSTKYYEAEHLFNKIEEKKYKSFKNHLQGMLNRTKNAFKSQAKKINSKFNKTNSYVPLNLDQSE